MSKTEEFNLFISDSITPEKLSQGCFLLILNALRRPPHLAMSIDGLLFHLAVKGQVINRDTNELLKIKGVHIVALKIKTEVSSKLLIQSITKHVKSYRKVDSNTSCLAPILNFFEETFEIDGRNINLIFDLIPVLQENDLIEKIAHLNLEEQIVQNKLILKKYTVEDIQRKIKIISKKIC